MARIRTIKPEFWVDDVMVDLPFETRLLFIGLWNFVDDEGYIEDKPKRIKMQIFPADNVLIEDSLSALCNAGRLHAFDSDQGPLLQVANWGRHQRINRSSGTRFTGITPRNRDDSLRTHAQFSERSLPEGKGRERKGSILFNSDESNDVEPKNPYPDDFEQWWRSYPRRQQKGDALKAWKQLGKDRLRPDVDTLVAASVAYAKAHPEKQFQKLPAGWLRAHSWNDEQSQAAGSRPDPDAWMNR